MAAPPPRVKIDQAAKFKSPNLAEIRDQGWRNPAMSFKIGKFK
jgi:hypothetical protein